MLGALAIAATLAFPLVGLHAGDWLVSRLGRRHAGLALTLLFGVVALALLLKVPVLGALVALATVVLGVGALVLGGRNLRRVPAPA